MKFCKKCGSLTLPKKEKSRTIMVCPKCGTKDQEAAETTISEKVKKEDELKMEVVDEEKDTAYPLVDKACPKCGHKKAYYWEIQTRASDEPATQFFKCERCKHTWRVYD